MANDLTITQANQLIASLHEQATGVAVATPTDLSSFISVANSTLAAGYDNVIGAISQMVGATLIAVRPYTRKFAGLRYDTAEFGGIIRKINFADLEPEASSVYSLTDGQSVDQYVVKKPKVLQTNYVGSDEWQSHYTIFSSQLNQAFTSPQALGEFFTGLLTHFSNEREQWLENMSRATVTNFIAGKNAMGGDYDVIHLLTEYNQATDLSLTSQTVRQPANFPAFMKWAYARVSELCAKMGERSELFQKKITGYKINRHTPLEYMRVYILDSYLKAMTAEVLADAYHDNFLSQADVEGVGFWQSIQEPDVIKVTPVVMADNGTYETAEAQEMSNVIGVVFDRDAIGYNIYEDTVDTTPYNARGKFYNMWAHSRVQYQNDFSEKGFVLALD